MSARTRAHLTFESDDLYQEVISRRGSKIAKLHYQSQRAAVDRIETIQHEEGIGCGSLTSCGLVFNGALAGIVTGTGGEGKSAGVFKIIGSAKITTPANAVAHNNLRASTVPGLFSGPRRC